MKNWLLKRLRFWLDSKSPRPVSVKFSVKPSGIIVATPVKPGAGE